MFPKNRLRILRVPEGRNEGIARRRRKRDSPRITREQITLISHEREFREALGAGFVLSVTIRGERNQRKFFVTADNVVYEYSKSGGLVKNPVEGDIKSAILSTRKRDLPLESLPKKTVMEALTKKSKIAQRIYSVGNRGEGPLIETPIGLFAIVKGNVLKQVGKRFFVPEEDERKIVKEIWKSLR